MTTTSLAPTRRLVMLALVMLLAWCSDLAQGFACDHGLSVNCFAALDNALGNGSLCGLPRRNALQIYGEDVLS